MNKRKYNFSEKQIEAMKVWVRIKRTLGGRDLVRSDLTEEQYQNVLDLTNSMPKYMVQELMRQAIREMKED